MSNASPDNILGNEDWSDLSQFSPMPYIDHDRLNHYRLDRIRASMKKTGAAMVMLVNPISLRYAIDYRTYGLFQSHIPSTYTFIPMEGPIVLYGAYGKTGLVDEVRKGRLMAFFDGAFEIGAQAELLADDIVNYLKEIGTDNRRVALEYVNPTLTQALMKRGLDVVDGVIISEEARMIKSEDELNCMKWAIQVAQHGIAKMREVMKPGVSELQLFGLLNYANIANNGDWHEGRMLASGDRINPWLQEASPRKIEAGDLVGFDTDMVGPFGYFADVSRTFFCGPGKPTKRQKELYRLAVAEVEHNMTLVKAGMTLSQLQAQSFETDEQFHENAYVYLIHGVGMCDEYPSVLPRFRGPVTCDCVLEPGMVVCVESYMGAVGERDGVKLEQQVLVTEDGCELLSTYPLEEILLD